MLRKLNYAIYMFASPLKKIRFFMQLFVLYENQWLLIYNFKFDILANFKYISCYFLNFKYHLGIQSQQTRVDLFLRLSLVFVVLVVFNIALVLTKSIFLTTAWYIAALCLSLAIGYTIVVFFYSLGSRGISGWVSGLFLSLFYLCFGAFLIFELSLTNKFALFFLISFLFYSCSLSGRFWIHCFKSIFVLSILVLSFYFVSTLNPFGITADDFIRDSIKGTVENLDSELLKNNKTSKQVFLVYLTNLETQYVVQVCEINSRNFLVRSSFVLNSQIKNRNNMYTIERIISRNKFEKTKNCVENFFARNNNHSPYLGFDGSGFLVLSYRKDLKVLTASYDRHGDSSPFKNGNSDSDNIPKIAAEILKTSNLIIPISNLQFGLGRGKSILNRLEIAEKKYQHALTLEKNKPR